VWEKLIEVGGADDEAAEARAQAAEIIEKQGDAARAELLRTEILRDFPLSQYALRVEGDPQRKQCLNAARETYQAVVALRRDGKPADAVARCDAVSEGCPDSYWTCATAELAIRITAEDLKNPAKAVERQLAFVARWPQHPDAPQHLYQAATTLAGTIGDIPRALEVYHQCAEAYPQSTYGEMCLYREAYTYMQQQMYIDYRKAMGRFETLAERYPHSDNARQALKYAADCQMQLRDTAKARAMHLKIMEANPNDYAAYLAAASGFQWVRMRKDAQ
jgi:tetratricopeptide (TPR) repeat protein